MNPEVSSESDEVRRQYSTRHRYAHRVLVEYLDIRPMLFETRSYTGFYNPLDNSFLEHGDWEVLMNLQLDSERNEYISKKLESCGHEGFDNLLLYLQHTKQTPLKNCLEKVLSGEVRYPDSQMREDMKQHKLSREKNGSLWYETVFQRVRYVMVECLDSKPIDVGKMPKCVTATAINFLMASQSKKTRNKHILDLFEREGEQGLEWLMQYLRRTNQDALCDYLAKIRNGHLIYAAKELIEYLGEQTKARRRNEEEKENTDLILYQREHETSVNQSANLFSDNDIQDLETGDDTNLKELHIEIETDVRGRKVSVDEREHPDEEMHKRVLDTAITVIKDHLVPQDVLDEFRKNGFLHYSDIRDVEELENTTEKNRQIVQLVREKSKDGYEIFKECLTKTKQNLLRTYLEKKENNDHTDLEELNQELKNETDARDRKEKRKEVLKYDTVVKAMEEVLTKAIKNGKDDFAGKEDMKERLKVHGSNPRECCYTIKSVFEDMTTDEETDRIRTAANEIKVLIDVKVSKASVEKNNCVVITMPCSSSTEMRRLLKTLQGEQFEAQMRNFTQALKETYKESIDVEAKIETVAIRQAVGSLRDQGIIDDKDGDSFCGEHPDILSNFYCSYHEEFCCDGCAHATHRNCSGVRQSVSDPLTEIEKDNHLSSNPIKEYRVRTDEPGLCSTIGLCALPNGELVIIDNLNKQLKKLDIFYKVNNHCRLDDPPFDVCVLDDGNILLSFGSFVQFVDVTQNPTLGQKLHLKNICYRLGFHKNSFYYTDNYSVYKCDAEGRHKEKEPLHTFSDGKIDCKRLIVSKDGKKIHIAALGKGLFVVDIENKNTPALVNRELKDCTDICVVSNDNILVCDVKVPAIFLVASQDGRIVRKVADKSHGLQKPWSLSFDKADSTMIVGRLGRDFISVLQGQFSDD